MAVAELYLATIMICATFTESDESLNLVKNAFRLALVVVGEQEADLKNVNNDGWMQSHSFMMVCD